jgi:hypothetical protein
MQVQRYFFIDALHFHPLPPPVRIRVGPPHPSSTSFLGPPHPSYLSCFFSNGAFSYTAYCVSSNSVRNQFVVFTTRAGRALATSMLYGRTLVAAGQVYGNWASLLGYLPARLPDAGLERAQEWEAVRARYGLNRGRGGFLSFSNTVNSV